MADDRSELSKRKRIKLLLGSFLNAQAALRCFGDKTVRTAPGSVFFWQDGYYEKFYRWLEYALDELRENDKRAFIGVWRVFVEASKESPRMHHLADQGIAAIENSAYCPSHVLVPDELHHQPRKSTHNGKREQNKEIRGLAAEGKSTAEIADIYGVTQRRIQQILAA